MTRVDLKDNQRIPQIMQLLEEMSMIRDPLELQKRFAAGIRQIHPFSGYISLSTRDLPPGWYRITRVTLDHLGPTNWRDNWKLGDTLPLHTGGLLGEVIRDPTPKLYQNLHVTDDPVLGDALAPLRSAMALPLFDQGKALNWGIPFHNDPMGFTAAQLEDQLMRGNLVGGMVRNLVNTRRIEELNRQLNEQMEQVANIQRSLIPQSLPDVQGLRMATSYVTSNQAGGDYYDFFDMGQDRLGVVVADVSGHGAGAATVMAMLHSILHDYQDRSKGPAAMLSHANSRLAEKGLEGSFVTAFMGVFDPDRRAMTISNAGHNLPAVRGRQGQVRELKGAGSLPLGVLDDAEYIHERVEMSPGETLVVYTDGITEAFSPPPEKEMFGVDRLKLALSESSSDPAGVIDSIHGRLFEHTQTRDRIDDQTIVAVRVEE